MSTIVFKYENEIICEISKQLITEFSEMIKELELDDSEMVTELEQKKINNITNFQKAFENMKKYMILYKENENENKDREEIPQPLMKPLNEYLFQWEINFLNEIVPIPDEQIQTIEQVHDLYDLVNICDYFSCKILMPLLFAKVASVLLNKNTEVMRAILGPGFEHDFTEEEYAKVLEESRWVDECD